jgi:hypothetical protein
MLKYKASYPDPEEGYIKCHKDTDKNDGYNNNPTVIYSIGDTNFDFLICDKKPITDNKNLQSNPKNLRHRICIKNGSALIMDYSKYFWHAIYNSSKSTEKSIIDPFLENIRISFSLRCTPHIFGIENSYITENNKSIYK